MKLHIYYYANNVKYIHFIDRFSQSTQAKILDHTTTSLFKGENYSSDKDDGLMSSYSSTFPTTNASPAMEKDDKIIASGPMFWGLFGINGTLLLLFASYIFVRIHKAYRRNAFEEKPIHHNGEQGRRLSANVHYILPQNISLELQENQIYNDIDKSSSGESCPPDDELFGTFQNYEPMICTGVLKCDIENRKLEHETEYKQPISNLNHIQDKEQDVVGGYLTVICE